MKFSLPAKISWTAIIFFAFISSLISFILNLILFPSPNDERAYYSYFDATLTSWQKVAQWNPHSSRFGYLLTLHLVPKYPYELLIHIPFLIAAILLVSYIFIKFKESTVIDKIIYSIFYLFSFLLLLGVLDTLWSIVTYHD